MAPNSPQLTTLTGIVPSQHNTHAMAVPQMYHYPPLPRPPPVHVNHARQLSDARVADTTRLQSSISSAGSISTGTSAVKQYSPAQVSQAYWYPPSPEQRLIDEKARSSWAASIHKSESHSPPRHEMVEDNSVVFRYFQEQQRIEEAQDKEDDHAIWILFWLSCLDPLHSFIGAIYTLLVLLTLTLAYPIRICKSQSSFGDQLIRILAPLFRHHLEMLHADSVEDAFSFEFRPGTFVLVNLSSPFLSMGVMLGAWVAAAFWLFAIIMGNPDGTEKGDDGRDTVLSVRNWWERYLLNAIAK